MPHFPAEPFGGETNARGLPMLTFNRLVVLQGGGLGPMEFAVEAAAVVNEIVDFDVSLLMGGPGYPVGTFAWSTLVESREQLATNMAKLLASDKYVGLSTKGQEFQTGPGDDRLRQVVHMAGFDPSEGVKVGTTVVTVSTEIANGQYGAAMEWAVEMTDYLHQLAGVPTGLTRALSGNFAEIQFVSLYDSPADLDRTDELEITDQGYMERLNGAATLFAQGTGTRGHLTRIA